jgi:hypothetical protein
MIRFGYAAALTSRIIGMMSIPLAETGDKETIEENDCEQDI